MKWVWAITPTGELLFGLVQLYLGSHAILSLLHPASVAVGKPIWNQNVTLQSEPSFGGQIKFGPHLR